MESDSSPHSVQDDFDLVRETVKRYGGKPRWAALDRIENRLVALNVEKLGLEEQLEAARQVPPLIRQTLEKALRLDMTQPPVTQDELRRAIDLLPSSPSFYSSVAGIERIHELEEQNESLRAGLEELLTVAERIRGGDSKLDPEEWYAARDYAKATLARCPASEPFVRCDDCAYDLCDQGQRCLK